MIVVTGAAGFIGSYLVGYLNKLGYNDLVLVDNFENKEKTNNWKNKTYKLLVDRLDFFNWIENNHVMVQYVFHLGARTDTTEFDISILNTLNFDFTKNVWRACQLFGLPMLYASSAATYGSGEFGFSDDNSNISNLKPLNPYGQSKQNFDLWALAQQEKPYQWVGLKFFNVYGPNEYHKGRMASVVFHTYNQIMANGKMQLFKSHHPEFKDGEQSRDFIYVRDVAKICVFFMQNRQISGIFNVGTGLARSFFDLAKATFNALNKPIDISFVDTPKDIREKYQYFTEAKMEKIRNFGYLEAFLSLEDGIDDYVKNYLTSNNYA